ncbi:MAG: glycosyl transferase family 2, partial [Oscillospiraceae bacterium]
RLMFPNGKEQFVAKRKPNFMGLVARQLPFGFLKKYEDYYLMKDKDLLTPTDVQFVSGCFFMMPTKIMAEIGGFDEKYFMYVEDADITQKALLKGRAVYNPEVYVFHSWNRQARKIGKAFFMQIKSMARYFKKWGFSLGLNKHV